MLHGSFKSFPRKILWCFKDLSRLFQESVNGVSRKIHESVKGVLKKIEYPKEVQRLFNIQRQIQNFF